MKQLLEAASTRKTLQSLMQTTGGESDDGSSVSGIETTSNCDGRSSDRSVNEAGGVSPAGAMQDSGELEAGNRSALMPWIASEVAVQDQREGPPHLQPMTPPGVPPPSPVEQTEAPLVVSDSDSDIEMIMDTPLQLSMRHALSAKGSGKSSLHPYQF